MELIFPNKNIQIHGALEPFNALLLIEKLGNALLIKGNALFLVYQASVCQGA